MSITTIPYLGIIILALASMVSLYSFDAQRRGTVLSFALGTLSLLVFYITERIQSTGALILAILLIASISYSRHHPLGLRLLAGSITITLAFISALHILPGISNYLIYEGVTLGSSHIEFDIYANIDKGTAGLALLILLSLVGIPKFRRHEVIGWVTIPILIVLVLVFGWLSGLGYDPKLPESTLAFILTNLLFSTIAEEALFRGLIQGYLTSKLETIKHGTYLSIALTSILFGLAHWSGGTSLIFLATIAGITYGIAFHLTGRLSAAILAHIGVNAGHFILLQYPA